MNLVDPWQPTDNFRNQAYSKNLLQPQNEEEIKLAGNVQNLLKESKNTLRGTTLQVSYERLEALCKAERKAEVDFFTKHFVNKNDNKTLDINGKNLNIDGLNTLQGVLKAVNILLANQGLLQNTLKFIQTHIDEEGNIRKGETEQLYADLNFTIPELITKAINLFIDNYQQDILITDTKQLAQQLETFIVDQLSDTITNMFIRTNNNDNKIFREAYTDLSNYLSTSENKEQFVSEILQVYGITSAKIQEQLKNEIKKTNKKNNENKEFIQKSIISTLKGRVQPNAGNAFETIANTCLEDIAKALNEARSEDSKITFQSIQTGQLNYMKADQIFTIATDFDVEKFINAFKNKQKVIEKTENSVRVQNIEALSETLKEVQADLIFISDKNYKLNGQSFSKGSNNYGGFGGETPNLITVQKVLSRVKGFNSLEDLIFVLVNSGKGMMATEDETRAALDVVALNIAQFLFDDVVVTEQLDDYRSSNSTMHVFNLNNVFVPLSVFLEAALFALEGIKNDLENGNFNNLYDYAHVSLTYNSDIKPNPPNSAGGKMLTPEDWTDFYNKKLKHNQISIHFFGDFVKFINKYMKILIN